MMKRRKRLWSLLLAISLTAAGLAGCGQAENESETDETDETGGNTADESGGETSPEEADPFGKYEEEITLRAAWVDTGNTVFFPGEPDYDSIEQNMFTDLYKERLGINITYDWTSADMEAYNTKWNMAMAQQNLPDFGYVSATQYKMLLEAGLVMDMTDIFEAYASDKYKEFVEADGGVTLSYSMQNGRMMGLPITRSQPDNVAIFLIRKDWLEQVNMEVPTTIDEMITVAEAFVENKLGGENTYGLAVCKEALAESTGLAGFFNGYGAYPRGWIKDDSGQIIYGGTAEEVEEPLLKLQEMYENGLINQDFSVTESTIVDEDITAGEVGIVYGTFWLETGVANNMQNDPDAEWVITEIPTADGSDPIVQGSVACDTFLFVNKDCEYPEAVVKIMNVQIDAFYNEDAEVAAKYATHTGPDGETSIQPSKYTATVYSAVIPWQNLIRYQEATHMLETGEETYTLPLSKSSYDNIQKYLAGDRSQVTAYYTFGPEGTYSVIEKMWDEGRIIVDEYQALPTETMTAKSSILKDALEAAMIKVIMGEDISTYEKAVEEWYQNGGQTITDEVNAWYEENKAD